MKLFSGKNWMRWLTGFAAALIVSPVFAQQAPPPPPLPAKVPPRNSIPRPAAPDLAQASPAAQPPAIVSPAVAVPAAVAPPPVQPGNPDAAIKWDAETKEHQAKAGEAEAKYSFWLTNISTAEVLINSVRTSCGCTVAKLPAQPWHIPPGGSGPIDVTLSLAGKSGLITKGVTVETSAGTKQLIVKANIPGGAAPGALPVQNSGTMGDTERLKNMQLALADRQIVFKKAECASCHSDPVKGKTDGRLIYAAACAICHNSHLRAAAVPDLRALPHPTDAEHWRKWITYGRAGSMMPAFAESEGGPLNEQQINALVDFMVKAFPSRPQAQPRPATGTQPALFPSPATAPKAN